MMELTRRHTGDLVRKVFELLQAHPEGLPADAVYDGVERYFAAESGLAARAPTRFNRVYEEATEFGIIAPAKAGWLVKEKDRWLVTDEGRRAFARFTDPEQFLTEAGRLSVKGWLSVNCPRLYPLASRIKYQTMIEYRLVRRVGVRQLFGNAFGKTEWQKILPLQKPRRFAIDGLNLMSIEALQNHLRSVGARYSEGGNTIYIPPASLPLTAFRKLAENYPQDAGIKIIKTIGGVDESRYVHGSHKKVSKMHVKLTHELRHLALVANLLFSKELGPRLYDLIELQCGDHLWTAYVTAHVEGREPSIEECEAGLGRIRRMEGERLIKVTIPDGYEDEDFEPPSCNGNAFMDEAGKFHYIDFQNFLLLNYGAYLKQIAAEAAAQTHFGDKSLLRGGNYLYQSIPGVAMVGKRGVEERMDVFAELMSIAGVSIEDRLVLDIGCNIGMMMAQYLKLGAAWCHGWDRAIVTPHTEQLLLALGCTRFSTTGGDITHDQPIEANLPAFLRPVLAGCVISYLAIQGHVGWLEALARLPWSFLIYEGHESDTRKDFERNIEELAKQVSFKVAGIRSYRDGDCDPRDVAILIRNA